MKHYVGLDVSQKEVSICVIDGKGSVIAEGKAATGPSEIVSWIEGRVGAMRTLLFEAANVLITGVRRFSPLKAWAVRLAARKGFKKAAGTQDRRGDAAFVAPWNHIRLEQGGDAGMTA